MSKIPKAFSFGGYDERIQLLEKLPKNTQILLSCSCARLVLPVFQKHYSDDNRLLTAIETIEGFVLGTHSIEQVRAAAYAAFAAASAAAYVADAAACAAFAAAYAAYAAYAAADSAARAAADATARAAANASYAAYAGVPWEDIHTLYLRTKGPKYQFQDNWKTNDVISLVNGIVQDKAFDRMPILADALQDAGLDDTEVLFHLQNDQCYLSDWVIWNVMRWE